MNNHPKLLGHQYLINDSDILILLILIVTNIIQNFPREITPTVTSKFLSVFQLVNK